MVKLKIKGMTCQHCAKTVKEALESVEGVKSARVYFPQGLAEVEGNAETKNLIEAVRRAGYDAEKIEEAPEVYVPKGNVYDLFILGGGSAGFAAAIRASDLGARVLIAEKGVIGGTCLNRGCIPSKYLIDVAKNSRRGSVDIRKVVEMKEELLKKLRKEKYWDVLEAYPNIEYVNRSGRFLEDGKALVGESEALFHKAVVTTGSRPSVPPIEGLREIEYYTSDNVFDLDHLPKHLLVIGGGAIGLELGQAFLRLGSEVTVIEALPEIAMGEEPELRRKLREILEKEGMRIITGAKVRGARKEKDTVVLEGENFEVKGTDLLVATGRVPNTEDIGLESVGVRTNQRGFIETNEFMQTSNPNIYAAGDCVGRMMLVTVAALEGAVAAENALLGNRRKVDYSSVPHAIFTDPELASVGMKEETAKEKGYKVEVRTLDFSKVPRAVISFKEGLIKMVTEAETGKVLGVHILAPHGAEIIHRAVPLVKFGLTLEDVLDMVDVYPTFSESVKLCAQSFKKDVTKLSCCAQ